MKFTRFAPIVLAATLLVGCAATPQATESASPAASAAPSSSAEQGITSSSKVKTLDEALEFSGTLTPEMSSAKYEVVNTASKLMTLSPDAVSPEVSAEVNAQLETVVAEATASTTTEELAIQISALQQAAATIEAARA